jgi:hypothetical protein
LSGQKILGNKPVLQDVVNDLVGWSGVFTLLVWTNSCGVFFAYVYIFFLRISIGIGLVYCWLGFYWMVSLGLLDSGIW